MASKGSMTKIYTYARTMKSNSDYATNMKRLSAQIFGEVGQGSHPRYNRNDFQCEVFRSKDH